MKIFNKLKNKSGITLIALVITIVVLLILAGVAINLAIGENGLFNQTKIAVEKYKEAQNKEEEQLQLAANAMMGDVVVREGGTVTLTEAQYQNIISRLETVENNKADASVLSSYATKEYVDTIAQSVHSDTLYSGTANATGTYNFSFPEGKTLSNYKYLIFYGNANTNTLANAEGVNIIVPATTISQEQAYTVDSWTDWYANFSIPNSNGFRIDLIGSRDGYSNPKIYRVDGIY